ncbi:glycosyltransferase [Devosia faecipullorum]|uniref:glycosyltransferase n=1 Tax=Devosia faecipullorum TaxID=2755039 RepID=UPI00187B68E0|nr:glycosyltransferase [Devosia faecipullorum]
MKKPSIVFVINSIAGGGAERVMMRLVEYSRDRLDAFEFHLVLLDNEDDAYAIPAWVRVHRLDCDGKSMPSVFRLFSLLRRLRPCLIMSFLTRANIATVLAAKALGFRSVISERSNTSAHHEHGVAGLVSRLIIRRTYSRADAVIAVSTGIADDLVDNFGVERDRMHIIANPIDAKAIRTLAEEAPAHLPDGPYIVAMGRFVRGKNFALLLEAFAASRLVDFDLVILGQGPLEQELKALADDLGLAGRARFPGFQTNPFPLISNGFAYVLPSNDEGFPNGLVEAMVTGIPVISTDCRSGPAEILDDRAEGQTTGLHLGKYGLLVPTNDKAAMVEALNHLVLPGERERLGKAAAEGAARYGLEVAVARYWDVLGSVMAYGGRSAQ